jgi:hypothetical protein
MCSLEVTLDRIGRMERNDIGVYRLRVCSAL